ILHGAHGSAGRAVASVFLRAALPAGGAYVGYLLSPSNNSKFRHGGGLIGFMGGYVIVTIIDIAMAARSTEGASARVLSIGGKF
nr:hypothetical protein [Deltaproteobacteria bacterium]